MISYYMLIIVVLYCFKALPPEQVPIWIVILAIASVFLNVIGVIVEYFYQYGFLEDEEEDKEDKED